MKQTTYRIYCILAVLAVLTGCQREIEYKGPLTDPQLVLFAANNLKEDSLIADLSVAHSFFFLDKRPSVYDPYATRQDFGYLNDARTELRIDAGDWIPMERVDSVAGQYSLRIRQTPQDSLSIRVYHKDYGEATATGLLPARVEVSGIQVTGTKSNYMKRVVLTIEPYQGRDDDVVLLFVAIPVYMLDTYQGELEYEFDENGDISGYHEAYGYVLYRNGFTLGNFYSEDFIFNELNPSESNTYKSTEGLYLSGAQLKNERHTVSFYTGVKSSNLYLREDDETVVSLIAFNQSAYKYLKSVEKHITNKYSSVTPTERDTLYKSKLYEVDREYRYTEDGYNYAEEPHTEPTPYELALAETRKELAAQGYIFFDDLEDTETDRSELSEYDLSVFMDEMLTELGIAEKGQVYSCYDNAIGMFLVQKQTRCPCLLYAP